MKMTTNNISNLNSLELSIGPMQPERLSNELGVKLSIPVGAKTLERDKIIASSVNSMYSNINKIEDDCSIDASKTKWGHSDIFSKIDKMEADPTKFDEKRSEILIDLDRIEYDVIQKIKDCSK